jgi:hypothetical protein
MNYNTVCKNDSSLVQGDSERPASAMVDFAGRFRNAIIRYDGLTLEVKGKLQSIKKIDEQPTPMSDAKERQPECAMDELNLMLYRLNEYNERLQGCLYHLSEIV